MNYLTRACKQVICVCDMDHESAIKYHYYSAKSLVFPGTSERECITGALTYRPLKRGATGTQVPLHM